MNKLNRKQIPQTIGIEQDGAAVILNAIAFIRMPIGKKIKFSD
jgi:hypothetical protein